MATDYEKIYRASKHALGPPTKEFVEFFETFGKPNAWILDIGCGQGRDALHIARLGHRVTGVDSAATGIRQLLEDASTEDLDIEGAVADIRSYAPVRKYDVVVIDRTRHMLKTCERSGALCRLLDATAAQGAVLIADEKSNIAGFRTTFNQSPHDWSPILDERGYLFARRID